VRNCEKGENSSYQDDYDFLLDETFIRWRLCQTKELDEYWRNILIDNPHLEKALQEAIVQFRAIEINRNPLSEYEKNDIYNAISLKINRYKRRQLFLRIASAAAVLVIGILSVLFSTLEKNVLSEEVIIGETLPEREIMLISGKEKINITHKSHIDLTKEGKALVTDSMDSPKELLLAKTELNKLIVPYGKRANLTLSDGTEVWLNSGTQFDFPSNFTGKKREVYVNGEVFIDVAHNPRIPFIAHVGDMEIQVHGTSFNISAYNEDIRKTVVLVDGKVKIKTADRYMTELLPNEKIEVMGSDIVKGSVNVSEYVSWTKGILEFEETPISEILRKIGRYYNVQFESSPDITLNDKSCSGKLFLSDNLDSVMTSVSVLSSTIYDRKDNIIYITKK
jgi:hypothetical protein